MGATLLALYVETTRKLSAPETEQLNKNINLAKQLGAEFIKTSGNDRVKAILDISLRENITHILVGKPTRGNLQSNISIRTFINKLIRYSGNIDVYVVGSNLRGESRGNKYLSFPKFTSTFLQYILSSLFIVITGLIFFPLKEFIGYQIVAFGFLFAVSILALFVGIGPIMVSATLSALIWDFFFIPPEYTFHIDRLEDILMLIMYFIIAFIGGVMTSRVRKQERLTRERELRTNALYQLTKELAMTSGIDEVVKTSVKYINKYSRLDCFFVLQDGNNLLDKKPRPGNKVELNDQELTIAEWSFQHSREAGRFTDTLPSSEFTFYPLIGNRLHLGVVVIRQKKPLSGDEEAFWDAYRTQISSALEREYLNDIARRATLLDLSDKLYKNLFNSISHELRIPVATIMGASDAMISGDCSQETVAHLSAEINKASERLNRLIDNLLNMSRLESGRISIKPDWHDVNDLVNKVTNLLMKELEKFNLEINIPAEMPLVRYDIGLMETVLHNLVLNATQYSKPGTTIRIKMYYDHGNFVMQVMDRGPGFPPDELQNVFNKFYRIEGSIAGGTGLGLSIVKGFVQAHKGTVMIENRKNGGARITVSIPSEIPDLDKSLL
jgi:two-component system sensor histidine kinase KdpD